jgi:hypothetical protein
VSQPSMVAASRLPGEAMVDLALRKQALEVTSAGRGGWRFALANGRPFAMSARLGADWLVLQGAALERPAPADLWPLLRSGGRLAGPGKLAIAGGRLQLAAELPVAEEIDLGTRVAEACADFRRAAAILEGHDGGDEGDGPGAPDPATEAAPASEPSPLPRLLAEAGWSASERAAGRWAVDLDMPGSFHQALVAAGGGGSVLLTADLAAAAMGPAGRRALALLLLEANGCVRLARAAATGAESARFEVRFASAPLPAELDRALASLSIACRHFAREARALASEEIALTYLALRGSATPAGRGGRPIPNRALAR